MRRLMTSCVAALAALLLLAAAHSAAAQEPEGAARQDSMKGVAPKNLAPVSTEVLRVKMPRPVERKLKNGLRVLVLENHRIPSVSFDLVLPASPLNDPKGLPGVANATATMLAEGTATRNSRQIGEALSSLGASLSISPVSGTGVTNVRASTLVENLDQLLALVAEVLLTPAFPQDELERWKARTLASLEQQRSQPAFLGNERLFRVLYPADVRSITEPTPESLKKLARQDLVEFYKAHYRPGGAVLGVTGDVTPEAIVAKLEKHLGAWQGTSGPQPKLPLDPPIAEKKVYLINRPDSVQSYLVLANRAIDRLSPDYPACMVMNRVLGQGPAARLFRNIREDKGFTYGVGSSFMALKYLNHFTASSSVRTEVTGPALDEFLNEFRTIRDKPVPKDELENAKRALVANFALSLENQNTVLGQILALREHGLPDDYWDTYPEKIMAVTAADVERVARKYVPFDNLQVVVVGDGAKIRDLLRKYGPVEEYDTEGRRGTPAR